MCKSPTLLSLGWGVVANVKACAQHSPQSSPASRHYTHPENSLAGEASLGSLPFLSPTRDHLSNKLLVLESLSQSPLRGNPNQDNIYIAWNRCSVSKW